MQADSAETLLAGFEFTQNPMDNVIAQSVLTKCDGQYRDIKYQQDIMAKIDNLSDNQGKRIRGSRQNQMMSGTLDTDEFLIQMGQDKSPPDAAFSGKFDKLNESSDPSLRDKLLDGDEENRNRFSD